MPLTKSWQLLLAALVVAGAVLVGRGGGAAQAAPPLPGEAAPGLTVATLANEPYELRPQPGQAQWLIFWASWCVPCRVEWPTLNEAARAHPEISLVAISVGEQPASVEDYLARYPASFTVALDPNGAAGSRYGVYGFPTHVLIDAQGRVAAIKRGEMNPRDVEAFLTQERPQP